MDLSGEALVTAEAAPPSVTQDAPVESEPPVAPGWAGTRRHPLNEAMAVSALFSIWGVTYLPAEGPICRQAEAQGLRCHAAEGSLDDLRRFNRPALLKLSNAPGEFFFATITQLDDQLATVILEDQEKKIPVEELASSWTGSYTLLWRLPSNFPGDLAAGASGPAVEWLRLHLAKALGEEIDSVTGDLFDNVLSEKVKAFQYTHGLRPDGIVGLRTMVHLVAFSDEPPLLVEKKKDP
jgi:general secretion pathway protein A